jgi:hypothetical protein
MTLWEITMGRKVAWWRLIWLQNAFVTVRAPTRAFVLSSAIGRDSDIMFPFPKSVAKICKTVENALQKGVALPMEIGH